mmetsp:Transcript_13484/g.39373  ORF Transcript_13484/g.39373 Transcript_13484/m.39373 type:complete len:562 (-) Transcript_13484:59-1744(-)
MLATALPEAEEWTTLLSRFVLFPLFVIVATLFFATARRWDDHANPHHHGPFAGIPLIPQHPHWLFGHLFIPRGDDQLQKQQLWCVDHADPRTGLCSFFILRSPNLSVLKAEHAQKLLRSNTAKRGVGSGYLLNRLTQKAFGTKNLVRMNGRLWKIHRSPVARALQSESALRNARHHIFRVGSTLVASLLRKMNDVEDKQIRVNVVPIMKMATMDIFGASAFGRDLGCCRDLELSRIAQAFEFIGEDIVRRFKGMIFPSSHLYFLPTEANRKFKHENRILRDFLRETIALHMDELKAEDDSDCSLKHNLLSQILAINKCQDSDDGALLDAEDVVDTLIVLLFAGYDSTAMALSFTLFCLASNPEVQEKCAKEARQVLNGTGVDMSGLDADIIKKLPYCHAAFVEALRLHTPATSTFRTIERPAILDGVAIEAGASVRFPIYKMHRDSRNFDSPMMYLPERWVRQTAGGEWVERSGKECETANGTSASSGLPPAGNWEAFLAFGSGARNCVGRRFALQEGTLLVAILVQKLKFELIPGYELRPGHTSVFLEPVGGLPMVISQR